MTTINDIPDHIKPLLGKQITAASMDKYPFKQEDETALFGEKAMIYFSDGLSLQISTEDSTHFTEGGELALALNQSKPVAGSTFKENEISVVKIFEWEKTDENLNDEKKCFAQIEFHSSHELILSCGFFYFDHESDKMECLVTGDLSISCTNELSALDFEQNSSAKSSHLFKSTYRLPS
ncbi:MAG: hypothetical protein AAFV95_16560 [Bacteroidota bacterium]